MTLIIRALERFKIFGWQFLFVLLLCACATQPALSPSAAVSPAASAQHSQAPVATPDPRVAWPPDPKTFTPQNATIVDSSEIDTDGDGVTELLVIYQDQGVGHGLVIRRELPEGVAYPLGGAPAPELFQNRWLANTVRDVNADGKVEIVVQGVAADRAEEVNVFQWSGKSYTTLLSINGPEGVALDDPQRNGVLDFTALQTLFQRSAIIRTTHAEWIANAYHQTSDVLFLLGNAVDYSHPEEAALAYYKAWNDGGVDQMFALLSEPQKSRTPLSTLSDLVHTNRAIHIESLTVDSEDAASAIITVGIRISDKAATQEQTSQQRWRLTNEDGQWKLAERLD